MVLRRPKIPVNVRLNKNASIFERKQTGTEYDPNKGHNVPVYQSIEVAAILEATNPPKEINPPQVENAAIQYVTGESAVDLTTNTKRVLKAIYNGLPGRLHLEPAYLNPAIYRFKFGRLTGFPIIGWFQPGGKIDE